MRHFTPDEANEALSAVRPLVERLVATRREHLAALDRQEELEGRFAATAAASRRHRWRRRPGRSMSWRGSSLGSWTRSPSMVRR